MVFLSIIGDCTANVAANFQFAGPTDYKSVATITLAAPPAITIGRILALDRYKFKRGLRVGISATPEIFHILIQSLCSMKESPMVTIEIIPDPELGGFTARVPDIPAYGEGATEDEAIADLREAVQAYIEAFGLEAALSRMSAPSAIRQVNWDLGELARG
jgi:predicted RNase H-like HicB family nuclease